MLAAKGTGVSSGIAEGTLFYYKRASKNTDKKAGTPDEELARWKEASASAAVELDALAEKTRATLGEEAATLFETHRMMLDDLDYTDRITELIQSGGYSAEAAVDVAGKEFSEMFAKMDDDYMKARSVDVLDISNRVVNILSGSGEANDFGGKPVIIAADDLTPSETV